MALFGGSKGPSTDLVASILERAGVGWFSLRLEGQEFSLSDNLRAWLPTATATPTLADYLNALAERDRATLAARLQAQSATKEPFSVEHTLNTPGGGKRFVHLQVALVVGPGGKPERINGLVTDIEFERAERMLLRHVREATDVIDSGILLLGPHKQPLWSNPAFITLTGYTLAEFSGMNPFELLQGPGLTEAMRADILASLNEGGVFSTELELLTKYGEPTWLQLDGAPQIDAAGELVGYAVVVKDINDLKAQQREILKQKAVIEEKNQDILDSITHAKRIQTALLPPQQQLTRYLPNHFLFYQPKDIVSGDFYYTFPLPEGVVFAVVDCTGHGVPGAFMSALGHTNLNEVIRELISEGQQYPDPAEILTRLDQRIRFFLGQDEAGSDVRDGMDVCLLTLVPRPEGGYRFWYAGANRPLWHCAGPGALTEYEPVKHPIGGPSASDKVFKTLAGELAPGAWLYLFTDGYGDQFGGPQHRKFGSKRLRELIEQEVMCKNPAATQLEVFRTTYFDWQGTTPQIDDVLLVGLGG